MITSWWCHSDVITHSVATVMGHTYISMHTTSCWIHHTNNIHHYNYMIDHIHSMPWIALLDGRCNTIIFYHESLFIIMYHVNYEVEAQQQINYIYIYTQDKEEPPWVGFEPMTPCSLHGRSWSAQVKWMWQWPKGMQLYLRYCNNTYDWCVWTCIYYNTYTSLYVRMYCMYNQSSGL